MLCKDLSIWITYWLWSDVRRPPLSAGTLFHIFVSGKLPIFSFIINKFIISNFVLHNPVHKLTHKCGFLNEMTCPADMGGRRTSLRNQYDQCFSLNAICGILNNVKSLWFKPVAFLNRRTLLRFRLKWPQEFNLKLNNFGRNWILIKKTTVSFNVLPNWYRW